MSQDQVQRVKMILESEKVSSGVETLTGLEQALATLERHLVHTRKCSANRLAIYSHLIAEARYPTQTQIDLFQQRLLRGTSFSDLTISLVKGKTGEDFNSNRGKLRYSIVKHQDDTIYVDVTHTLSYKFNSGIQRVVREIVSVGRNHKRFVFYKMCHVTGHAELLTQEEIDHVCKGWEHEVKAKAFSAKSFILYRKLISLIPTPIKNFLLWLKNEAKSPVYRHHFWYRKKISLLRDRPIEVPFLVNAKILLPELITDECRLERYLPLFKEFSQIRSVLILYDLIPIYYPEFHVIGYEFLSYLRLLRVVKAVSCISKSVAQDVINFTSSFSDNRGELKIYCHYLGRNLNSRGGTSAPSYDEATQPALVSIGTIEPRKNQVRILLAAINAMDRGCTFSLTFVGNPGWKNTPFLECFAHFKGKGYPIYLENSVSNDRIRELLSKSQMSIFCSLAEGFGLPIVESLDSNTPCITSNRGSMKELAELIGGCVLVDPESVSEISDAIESTLMNSDLRSRLQNKINMSNWPSWDSYLESVVSDTLK